MTASGVLCTLLLAWPALFLSLGYPAVGLPAPADATEVRSLVRQSGAVLNGADLRRAGLPRTGERVNVIDFDTARVRLLTTLGQRGYADAEVRDTILIEDSVTAIAEVAIEPGRRTTIEAIEMFQEDSGLPVTGLMDPPTQDAMQDVLGGRESAQVGALQAMPGRQPDARVLVDGRRVVVQHGAVHADARIGHGIHSWQSGPRRSSAST